MVVTLRCAKCPRESAKRRATEERSSRCRAAFPRLCALRWPARAAEFSQVPSGQVAPPADHCHCLAPAERGTRGERLLEQVSADGLLDLLGQLGFTAL